MVRPPGFEPGHLLALFCTGDQKRGRLTPADILCCSRPRPGCPNRIVVGFLDYGRNQIKTSNRNYIKCFLIIHDQSTCEASPTTVIPMGGVWEIVKHSEYYVSVDRP